jgi:UDP-N-acetylmuramate: L-alanyl-gamma-D-glutamyl-meso-diaminopimelate ligase
MHVHILGICGTFMGGVAVLAKALGHRVTGSDAQVYPPMSEQLARQGIGLMEGYDPAHLEPAPDQVLVGNALSRGSPAVEHLLNRGIAYTSGPQWLAENLLKRRQVLAVAGTHGKTTTAAILTWILEHAGLRPGFLIGGVPENFGLSARLGEPPFFVVEADEYDTAFFDKRSKFVHYRPRIALLTNLEYDHADIFPDLAAIQRQFHHLLRTVPGEGLIIRAAADPALEQVIAMGCWTRQETFGEAPADWHADLDAADGSRFRIHHRGRPVAAVRWDLAGVHNVQNALAAVAAAHAAGVQPALAAEALAGFGGVRRRLERRGVVGGVSVYDDFAHHPTAIRVTIDALRRRVGGERIIAVLEPRSNTMRLGVHRDSLGPALQAADRSVLYAPPGLAWDPGAAVAALGHRARVLDSVEAIVEDVVRQACAGDHVLVMSNGSFGGIHRRLLQALERRHGE